VFLFIHIFFIIFSFVSFNTRFFLRQFRPEWLQKKWMKIAPHIIDTGLLLSGVALVYQEQWLQREHGWVISKLVILLFYIVFGVLAMRGQGVKRWLAYGAAIACFATIFQIAITKTGFVA
jgi:uncharacterized membrane protein SirB2